jgi:hypothetical protein
MPSDSQSLPLSTRLRVIRLPQKRTRQRRDLADAADLPAARHGNAQPEQQAFAPARRRGGARCTVWGVRRAARGRGGRQRQRVALQAGAADAQRRQRERRLVRACAARAHVARARCPSITAKLRRQREERQRGAAGIHNAARVFLSSCRAKHRGRLYQGFPSSHSRLCACPAPLDGCGLLRMMVGIPIWFGSRNLLRMTAERTVHACTSHRTKHIQHPHRSPPQAQARGTQHGNRVILRWAPSLAAVRAARPHP